HGPCRLAGPRGAFDRQHPAHLLPFLPEPGRHTAAPFEFQRAFLAVSGAHGSGAHPHGRLLAAGGLDRAQPWAVLPQLVHRLVPDPHAAGPAALAGGLLYTKTIDAAASKARAGAARGPA